MILEMRRYLELAGYRRRSLLLAPCDTYLIVSSCKGRASSRRPGPDEICEFSPVAKKVLMLTGEAELIFTDKILVCGCENVAGKFRQKW